MTVDVTDDLEELMSPAWLTAALGLRFPGIRVTTVTPGPVVERVCTNARFSIECDGGMPSGLSPDLCAKGFFAEAMRGSGPRASRKRSSTGICSVDPDAHLAKRVCRRRSDDTRTAS